MSKDADFGRWAKVMLDELTKLGVKFEEVPIEMEQFKRFNLRFMLALDCYMPSVARSLLKDCKEDIKLFGFEYAQKKWAKFVYCSLTGKGIKPGLDLDFEAFCEVLEGESRAVADG